MWTSLRFRTAERAVSWSKVYAGSVHNREIGVGERACMIENEQPVRGVPK